MAFANASGTHVDAENASHPVEVVLVPGHRDDLGDDCLLRPVRAELLDQLLEVVGGILDGFGETSFQCVLRFIVFVISRHNVELGLQGEGEALERVPERGSEQGQSAKSGKTFFHRRGRVGESVRRLGVFHSLP